MGVQFFGGKFFKCVDDYGERVSVTVRIFNWFIFNFHFFHSNRDDEQKIIMIFADCQQPQWLHAPQLYMVKLENIVR